MTQLWDMLSFGLEDLAICANDSARCHCRALILPEAIDESLVPRILWSRAHISYLCLSIFQIAIGSRIGQPRDLLRLSFDFLHVDLRHVWVSSREGNRGYGITSERDIYCDKGDVAVDRYLVTDKAKLQVDQGPRNAVRQLA